MLKKVLPVAAVIVLILLITVVASAVKSGNDKTPSVSNANEVYASYDGYKVTYDRLYNHMKQSYGLNEAIFMIDEILFADELSAAESNGTFDSEEYKNFVLDAIFEVSDFSKATDKEADEYLETWNDLVSSLKLNGKITKSQANDATFDEFNIDSILASAAWKVVLDEYQLTYVRQEWAYKEYLANYIEENETTEENPFVETTTEDSDNSIEAYYEANYLDTVDGFFIPFTSQKAAYAAMEAVGINTYEDLIGSTTYTGWIKGSYDVYSKSLSDITEDDYMTYEEVFEAFVKMYNMVMGYLNNGEDILTEADYTSSVWAEQTAHVVANKFKSLLNNTTFGATITMPESFEVALNGTDKKATVTWSIANSTYATYTDGVLVGTEEEFSEGALSITLNYVVKFDEFEYSSSAAVNLHTTATSPVTKLEVADFGELDAFKGYTLNESAFAKDITGVKFNWTEAEAEEINSTLATYFTTEDATITLPADPSNRMTESYTVTPVACGNYYFLIIKLGEHTYDDLYVKDEDGNYVKDDDDNYTLCDGGEEIKAEIIEKKIEALKTENAVAEMLYQYRYEHGLQIYDRYIEALYEYQYNYFYGTTLSKTDYNEFKETKKNQKSVILSFQTEAGNKKSVVKLTADDLYDRLEPKYGAVSLASLVENYIVINSEFNTIYNSYLSEKEAVLDKTYYKNLLTSDVSSLKKNFEAGYFTYSYLSYYGLTPAFPASYGWSNFIKDYFGCYSDQEVLTSNIYGGTVYSNAANAWSDSLLKYDTYADVFKDMAEELNVQTIKSLMEAEVEDYFSMTVVNVIAQLDTNYNSTFVDDDSNSEDQANWTEAQTAAAKELLEFIYEVAPQTGEDSLSDQLAAVVTLYNNAAYVGTAEDNAKALEEGKSIYEYNYFGYYKLLGIVVKAESSAEYTNSSSLVEEFLDECADLYNSIDSKYYGKTLDSVILSNPVETVYGWHLIGAEKLGAIEDLPSEEEIELYRAINKVTEQQSSVDSINESIESAIENGYSTSSYEAQLANAEALLAKYQEELKAVLAAKGLDEDYELDEDAQARIDAWYTAAETAYEDSSVLSKAYAAIFTKNISKFEFTSSTIDKDRFETFIEVLIRESLDEE